MCGGWTGGWYEKRKWLVARVKAGFGGLEVRSRCVESRKRPDFRLAPRTKNSSAWKARRHSRAQQQRNASKHSHWG